MDIKNIVKNVIKNKFEKKPRRMGVLRITFLCKG